MTVSTSKCRSCSASIVWMKTSKGKTIPVDTATIKERDLEFVFDQRAGARNDYRSPLFNPRNHTAHFATCPDADKHRRR
jgi:hypothetical protein